MNDAQRVVTQTYASGAFRKLIATPNLPRALKTIEDRTFVFLMNEMMSEDGCDSVEEAIARLEQAQADVTYALSALYRLRREREQKRAA